jgi:hypothetical protein
MRPLTRLWTRRSLFKGYGWPLALGNVLCRRFRVAYDLWWKPYNQKLANHEEWSRSIKRPSTQRNKRRQCSSSGGPRIAGTEYTGFAIGWFRNRWRRMTLI